MDIDTDSIGARFLSNHHHARRFSCADCCISDLSRARTQAEDCAPVHAPHKPRKVGDARADLGRPLSLAVDVLLHARDDSFDAADVGDSLTVVVIIREFT